MEECRLYNKLDNNKIQCLACFHFCIVEEGKTGLCGVRQNKKGVFYSLVYGRVAAANIDPVEKKPLFHFLPGSYAFSVGTLGCNFFCANCQNFDISQMFGAKGNVEKYGEFNLGDILSPEQIVASAIKYGCESIAYTYNEPTVFLEYALDTMKIAKQKGVKNIWVSNGYMSEQTLNLIAPYLDAINIDIKSWSEDFYKEYCGAEVKPVLDNCQKLKEEGVWPEITTLLIPGLTDNNEDIQRIAGFIKNKLGPEIPWHISAFSSRISWKLQNLPDTSPEKMEKAKRIGEEAGLKYVYLGNI
ncbi:MAG: AmmeMemoRadiSam system radical SAM enzyme [Patescibacteria group bacterium]